MNRRIKAVLATLPYREMVELSKEIASGLQIKEGEGYPTVADVLTGMAAKADTEFVMKEKKMVDSMFTRKKQIVVQPYENGFKISIPAQNIDVYCDDVRDGISQAIDNLVAIRCMS